MFEHGITKDVGFSSLGSTGVEVLPSLAHIIFGPINSTEPQLDVKIIGILYYQCIESETVTLRSSMLTLKALFHLGETAWRIEASEIASA